MPFPLDRIRGSIPPLFTPFRNGEIDTAAYARLIEFQISGGSHGILVNGTTSEPASLGTVKELKEKSATFIGMKHAATDLDFVSDCFAAVGTDFRIFVGLEELSFPMMAVGACGLMNAVGNLKPRVLAEMCEAVWRGDLKHAQALHHRLHEINKAVFFDTNPIPMKYMAKKLGLIASSEHRLPMMPATPELEKRLDAVLARAKFTSKE